MSLDKIEARETAADLGRLGARLLKEVVTDPLTVPGYHLDTVVCLTLDNLNALAGRAWMMGARVVMNTAAGRQPCRICGCWELEACDQGCGWGEPGLCTVCAEGK
jgi:hypothetical protein